jgi:hypothetical protein
MMRIVMENADLSFWPALSLVIFFATTLAVLAWLYRPGSREFYRKLGGLALEEQPRAGAASDNLNSRETQHAAQR